MIIERIDSNRLLITLKSDDLDAFEVDADTLNMENKDQAFLIREIISLAFVKVGLHPNLKRLYVETLPYGNGCFLLVTIHDKSIHKKYHIKQNFKHCLIHISNAETLLIVIKHLHEKNYQTKSTLYHSNTDGYYLLLKYNQRYDTPLRRYLCEYGTILPCSALAVSKLDETCSILYFDSAVTHIGALL